MGKQICTLTSEQLLKKKRIYDEKKDPIWVVLEREMRANADKKPYNETVGAWLKFLRDLKYFFHVQRKKHYKKLQKACGPPWYYEFSAFQRSILLNIKTHMQQDVLQGIPKRIKKDLRNLGITLNFSNNFLLSAILNSEEDAGIFFWKLYNMYYKSPPSELIDKYDVNAKLMMSAIVFVDIEECKRELLRVTAKVPPPPPKPPRKYKKYYEPKVKFGEYLQKIYVPNTSIHPLKPPKPPKPLPLAKKIRLRTDVSYEVLAKQNNWMERRKQRNFTAKPVERICKYKFWTPPSTLRNTDPKKAAYILALKMFQEKARPKYMKYKLPFDNIQFHIKNVAYINGHPIYCLEALAYLPTEYIIHNGGYCKFGNEYITNILGHYKYPNKLEKKCPSTCDCNQWNDTIVDLIDSTKCSCGHRYDYGNEGKVRTRYFHNPANGVQFWIDYGQVYQVDPWPEFVMRELEQALDSNRRSPTVSSVTIAPNKLKNKELLAAFLSELSDTPLMIPHLPKANLLNNLQDLVRRRIKGRLSEKSHKQLHLKSQRRQLQLDHIDFKARAYRIPFTLKELKEINFSHRPMIQKIHPKTGIRNRQLQSGLHVVTLVADQFYKLLNIFVTRNRNNLIEQTRLLWPTMHYDQFGNKSFLDVFFTYMPGRWMDVHLVNPYSSVNTPKYGAKTCPPKGAGEPTSLI